MYNQKGNGVIWQNSLNEQQSRVEQIINYY